MSWLRLYRPVVTTVVLSGYVTVLTASSTAVCFSSSGTTSGSESCPLNLTSDKSCSMTQCRMHRTSSDRRFEGNPHETPSESNPDHQTVPSSSGDCQVTCPQEDLPPLTVLGGPGFLPIPPVVQALAQGQVLVIIFPAGYSDWAVQISTPPPRY